MYIYKNKNQFAICSLDSDHLKFSIFIQFLFFVSKHILCLSSIYILQRIVNIRESFNINLYFCCFLSIGLMGDLW